MFLGLMFVVGACIGSFLCCETRRIHMKEVDNIKLGARSVCLKCKHKLSWYENIPIISWVILRGKCRKCGARIGYLEIFSEIATAIIMTLVGTTIDIMNANLFDWLIFASLFLLTGALVLLALYDGAYGELPTVALIVAGIFAIIYVLLNIMQEQLNIVSVVISFVILGGLYLALYLASKGKWVGDGDWILAGIIGLALGQPFYALMALFISNFSACIIMWPFVHKNKNRKIYFGPFLVFGFVVALIMSKYGIISI